MTVFPFRRPYLGLSIGAGMLGLAEVRRDWRQGRGRRILEQLAEVWARLPVRKDFPELILAVSDMARKDRLAIPGMNYQFDDVEGDLALQASINFRVVGKYAAIRRFIHRIETASPYLLVEGLDATRKVGSARTSSQKPSTHVVFNVRVVTFLKLELLQGAARV
ncbi:type 4a pilus biogenesis protein PilO [Nitrospiraceae bacterium AH_259_D15_M11_P09]|nr:type 4a pilus biogenesis protein PilO [Nitrospiraceae bacterium AH_259_D15_M11_P09]